MSYCILALESSCDETAAAVLKAQGPSLVIASNGIASQIKLHAATGGVVPEVAARAHIEKIIPVTRAALGESKTRLRDISAIAVTAGPGLITSLRVGVDTAKALALALRVPLIAVNHIEAHIYSPFIKNSKFEIRNSKFLFPAISLVVSGGHSELFLVRGWLEYKKIGQTLDDAAGEAFDKIAKLLGLPYPGGPALARLAQKGTPTINFPRPMINSKDFNFSFSGLKTAVLYYLRDHKIQAKSFQLKAYIAASAQAAIVDVLVSKTLAAAKKYKVKSILLGGGVAANSLLRSSLRVKSHRLKARFLVARPEYCTDNAGMIAFSGWLHSRKKHFSKIEKVTANANWELD